MTEKSQNDSYNFSTNLHKHTETSGSYEVQSRISRQATSNAPNVTVGKFLGNFR